jgi:ABC-type lipoprotein release transport system permease subunit
MQVLRIAWRNLWRNRRRTAITVTAVALNTAILVGTLSLMEGMRLQMVRSATRLLVGDVQIHASGFRADRSMYSDIDDPESVLDAIAASGGIAAPRAYGFGLLSAGTKSAGAMFVGVDPAAERAAFELADEIASGTYLDGRVWGAVIGGKLARSLNADIGTELVAVVQGADGSLGNELLTVVGVLKTVGEELDRGALFLRQQDFDTLFVAGGRIHEIAISGQGRDPVELAAGLRATLGVPSPEDEDAEAALAIESWHQIMPMVSDMVNMFGAVVGLFAFVFFLGAGFGVLNTMLMATHDRVREFGVLKALGATPGRIVRDIAAEGLVLGLFSSVIGLGVGVAASAYFYYVGIDLSSFGEFGFSGVAWDPVWRGELTASDAVASVAAMLAACVVASLYPGVKAARLDAARAMTHV